MAATATEATWKGRVRVASRTLCILLAAAVTLFFLAEYVDGRRAGEWNYQANLWMALSALAIGIGGLRWPRIVAFIVFPFAVLWLLWALAYAGLSLGAFVVGGVPLAVALLLFLSAKPRRARRSANPTAER